VVALAIASGVLYNNSLRIEKLFVEQLNSVGAIYSSVLDSRFDEKARVLTAYSALAIDSTSSKRQESSIEDSAMQLLSEPDTLSNIFFISENEDRYSSFIAESFGGSDILVSPLDSWENTLQSCHELVLSENRQLSRGAWIMICTEEYIKRAYVEPLFLKGDLIGYVGTVMNMEDVDLPSMTYLGVSSSIFLVDHDGHIISSANQKLDVSHMEELLLSELDIDYESLNYEQTIHMAVELDGLDHQIVITKMDHDFYLMIVEPESQMNIQQINSNLIYLLSILTYFSIVLILTLWLIDREMRPVQALQNFICRIQDVDYSESLPEEYSNIPHEVGDLARAFESMRLYLNDLINNLESEINRHEVTQHELGVMTEILENSNEGVTILDNTKTVIYVNPAYCKISGYSIEELIGINVSIFDPEGKDFRDEVMELLEEHGNWNGEVNQLRKAGSLYPASLIIRLLRGLDNQPRYYFVITEDLTEKMAQSTDLNSIINTDVKTGLPNSIQMRTDIETCIDLNQTFALIYIGVDDFKSINEIYGFNAGDSAIVSLSEKLPLIMSVEDKLYRIGGDEFAFLIDLEMLSDGIDKFIQQVQDIIRHPIRRNNISIYMTASMGVSSYPQDADNCEDIITASLSALNKAKLDARGFHYYFSKELREQSERRQMILSQLYEAVERDEFNLLYQPKINADTDTMVGVEALLRWNNESLGFVSPAEFIPVAEDSAIIEKVGRWVIKQATEDLREMHELGSTELSLSVNLSGQQFKDESLFAWILENLSELSLPPENFEIEITESLLLENLHEAVPQLNLLKQSGVMISIDDFGTGYSSLSYLQHLPIDILKIDKSFLVGVGHESPGTIINAIIELGRALDLKVVAEGIETKEQKNFLRAKGCNIHQGYFYDKPLTLDTLISKYRLNRTNE